MKLIRKAGATSEIWQVFIADSSSTTGAGLAGLTNASSSLTAYYHRDTDTTATAISLVTMTVGTFTSSGFKEIDATHMPGWYQFCPPNAAIGSGAKSCGFHLQGATNMAPLPIEVDLVAYDPMDTVRLGLTALPNAVAGANTGLPVVGTQIPNATAGAAGGVFIAGTNAATTVTTAFTTTFTGNLTGSVASVSGNVGGNVSGSVGSVTGLSSTIIADAVLSRDVANVEGAAGQNTLCGVVLGTFHWSIVGTDWVITKTGGGSFATVPTTDTPGAFPITAVG